MVRAALSALLALSVTGCAVVDGTSRSTRPLTIASWNLEHLAETDGEGCRPRTEGDSALLRRHTEALDADVIALQEVQSVAAARRVFDPRLYDVILSTRPSGGRGSECRGLPGQAILDQYVGFAIRKGISWTRNPDLSALGLGDPNLRWGVDVTLDYGRPLRLLAIHLKSGCNSGRTTSDADCDVLFAQAPVLEGWTEARARAGEAFLVLGDWNRRLTARDDAFLADLSDGDPSSADLTLASDGRPAGCKARFREFIDHIAIGATARDRIAPGSFAEYLYGGAPEAEHPTDHCPISAVVLP